MSTSSILSASSTASATPSPTDTSQPNPGSAGGGPNSPLLFFVALGFGVVFTNLWIIVGVKYCFRYNQRNRARLAGEDPDGVDLNAMPRQRRRREKKLMTIDEVNERFPLTKYKTWRSNRADQGLPTAGGITNAPSRPVSVKNLARDSHDGIESQIEPKTPTTIVNEKASVVEHGRAEQIEESPAATGSNESSTATKSGIVAPEPALIRATTNDEEPDAADRIETAIPPEQLPDPGDTCAICIDTIEDDDDIRGLSCGHAFHASCVDPWLTSRRACCPLCKADYYVPKPRPEGAPEEPRRSTVTASGRAGARRVRPGPFNLPSVFLGPPQPASARSRSRIQSEIPPSTNTLSPEVTTEQQNQRSWLRNVHMPSVPGLSRIRQGRGNRPGEQPAEGVNPSPSQLEAGRT